MQRRQFLKTARDLTIGGLAALVSTTSCSLKSDEEQIKELLLESANVFQRIGDGSLSEEDTKKFMKYFKDHITEEFARKESLPAPNMTYEEAQEHITKNFALYLKNDTIQKLEDIEISNIEATINGDKANVIYNITFTETGEKLPEPLVSYTIITQSGLTKINNKWKIEDIISKDLIIKHPFCYGHYLMSPFIKID